MGRGFVLARVDRRERLVAERDAPVHRQDDDALEARDERAQPLDLLEETSRRARRRREHDLRLDRIELRGDRLAGEQQIERLHDRVAHRRPIGD